MRPSFAMKWLIVAASLLLCAAPVDARGGKGGGGGGRGRVSSGRGRGSGGPKWSRQSQSATGGQRVTENEQQPIHGGNQQIADKQSQPGKDKQLEKSARSTPTNNIAGDPSDGYNKKQKQLEIEQRNCDK